MNKLLANILCFLFPWTLHAMDPEYAFDKLSISDGLSHNSITSIIQDHKGLLWIGTNDGLNIYDGYNFTIFRADAFDSTSLSNNKITRLLEDSKNNIWVGTRNGLNLFNWDTYRFKQISFEKLVPEDAQVFIKAIFEDSDSNLWIGTYGQGLFLYDYHNQNLKKIPLDYGAEPGMAELDNMVSSIIETWDGKLLIATNRNGIIHFNRKNYSAEYHPFNPGDNQYANSWAKTIYEDNDRDIWVCTESHGVYRLVRDWEFEYYQAEPGSNSISNNIIKDIFQDESGLIWMATDGGGINILNKETGEFSHIKYNASEASSLSTNAIYTFFRDSRDILWIGTFGGGINILDPNKKPFHHYTQKENPENSLSHPSVLSFEESREGYIWIGTDGGGLNRFNPGTGNFRSFTANPEIPGSLSSNSVTSILEDSRGILWIGTFNGGLNRFDKKTGKFSYFKSKANDPHSLANTNVWQLFETSNRELLIGTLGGLNILDPESMKFTLISAEKQGSPSQPERILSITEDSQGRVWIGSESLWQLNMTDYSLREIDLIIENDTLNWEYDVRVVKEDSRGNLWVGTEGGGLLLYDEDNESFKVFSTTDGLPNNAIHEIQEDAKGFLWLSTNKGLSKFDPVNHIFRNYDYSDGLQSNQFSYSASLKSRNGKLYFGGVNGFNVFDPSEIKDNPFIPPVIFTDFRLFNRPVSFDGKNSPLNKHISETKAIVLNHRQSVLTFEFASLNYTSSQKNQYEFIMDGFEKDWNKVGPQRTATYTNLDPGDYTFRVRGSNNDGVWNTDGAEISITVLPPFWETKLAFVFYGIFILFLLYSFRRYAISRAQMKNELKLKDLEKQKIQEVNQMKMQFFTNISHEFRTPLTLILSPLEKLVQSKNDDPAKMQLYTLMYRNASRLLSLINQLMDLRKIEKGSMDLKLNRQDIVKFICDIKNAFNELASEKNIDFRFSSNIPNMKIWFDADKVDKITYNLLSNAFKFTGENGKITVKIKLKTRDQVKETQSRRFIKKSKSIDSALAGGYIEISVKDTGIGISKEKQSKIFSRFYQAGNRIDNKNSGTGIGLSLSRDLALIHKGDLRFISVEEKGSKFYFRLPIEESVYDEDNFIKDNKFESRLTDIPAILDQKYDRLTEDAIRENMDEDIKKDLPKILIVEDNSDVRKFIRISLEPAYNIIEAEDGQKGFEIALTQVPDIIISDIMMPVMDGIELVSKISKDPVTSHIPIIFLTAKTNEKSKLDGLETGVIDYISKPFNPRMLALKVRNLIDQKNIYAEKIRKALILEPGKVEIESLDEKFLKKAKAIVVDHISDSEFDVQQFVNEMGMSRSVLYRKLRAVTNQSANEFINLIRLKRAAQLLEKKTMNVSEISYMVGFNDPQYFSKCFRKQYGKTPSQYSQSPSAKME